MFFNPIMMIILAGLSLLVGTIVLIQTEIWLSLVPFVVFTFLFCVSLFLPVTKRTPAQTNYRPVSVPKPRKQWVKLTTARLSRAH